MGMKTHFALCLIGLLAACTSPEDTTGTAPEATATGPGATTPIASATPASATAAGGSVLALEGLGDLAIGKPVPAGTSFTGGGESMPGSDCTTLTSRDYPGVYALVEGGVVRRLTVARDSQVRLVEGIGVGSTEREVLAAFPGFRATPHKYIGGKGKYLTQPGDDPRLRFEIGEDGKVTGIHVGMNPQLGYVEGCA